MNDPRGLQVKEFLQSKNPEYLEKQIVQVAIFTIRNFHKNKFFKRSHQWQASCECGYHVPVHICPLKTFMTMLIKEQVRFRCDRAEGGLHKFALYNLDWPDPFLGVLDGTEYKDASRLE